MNRQANIYKLVKGYVSGKTNETIETSGIDLHVYWYLIHKANKLGWPEWFSIQFSELHESNMCKRRPSFYSALESLEDANLIQWEKGKHRSKSAQVKLLETVTKNVTVSDTVSDTVSGTLSVPVSVPLSVTIYRRLETLILKTLDCAQKEFEIGDYSFLEFLDSYGKNESAVGAKKTEEVPGAEIPQPPKSGEVVKTNIRLEFRRKFNERHPFTSWDAAADSGINKLISRCRTRAESEKKDPFGKVTDEIILAVFDRLLARCETWEEKSRWHPNKIADDFDTIIGRKAEGEKKKSNSSHIDYKPVARDPRFNYLN